MGAFLYEKPLLDLLPKLKNFLKEVLKEEDVEIEHFFGEGAGLSQDSVSVKFKAGRITEPYRDWKYYGTFSLTAFPGNSSMVISHDLWLNNNTRKKGIGQFLQDFKKEIAKAYEFDIMYCTTLEDNAAENYILAKNDWKVVNRFISRKYGHKCLEWKFDLPKEEK